MAGKELKSEAGRFKYLFAGGENIGCEQFLGLLNSKALWRVVPVRMSQQAQDIYLSNMPSPFSD